MSDFEDALRESSTNVKDNGVVMSANGNGGGSGGAYDSLDECLVHIFKMKNFYIGKEIRIIPK